MKNYGQISSAFDVPTKAYVDARIPSETTTNVNVVSDAVCGFLSWEGETLTINYNAGAIRSTDEVRLFRHKRRRLGILQGRIRKHGWRDCSKDLPLTIGGPDNDKRIVTTGIKKDDGVYKTLSEYQRGRGEGLSLNTHCAIAIFRNGIRISDFMHFCVYDNGAYGAW